MKEYQIKLVPSLNPLHDDALEVQRILALDLGIGSYGIAVQERSGSGEERKFIFPIVRSCTLPADWAELKEERTRRRMWRTRRAHIEREQWLREVFERCGLNEALLRGRRVKKIKVEEPGSHGRPVMRQRWALDENNPPDFRLEREFPPSLGQMSGDGAPSDDLGSKTVYSGAALRCLLLLGKQAQIDTQGRPLEPWQIFKALHSAIQKRGYDPYVPWARSPMGKSIENSNAAPKKVGMRKKTEVEGTEAVSDSVSQLTEAEKKEEKTSLERALTMQGIVEGLSSDERYQHPCFWEAFRMGMWDADSPEVVQVRQTHHARSCKWADQEDPANKFKNANERDPYARLPAIFPRKMVEAELIALCESAARQLPALSVSAYEIAYGPTGISYPNIPRRDPAKHLLSPD